MFLLVRSGFMELHEQKKRGKWKSRRMEVLEGAGAGGRRGESGVCSDPSLYFQHAYQTRRTPEVYLLGKSKLHVYQISIMEINSCILFILFCVCRRCETVAQHRAWKHTVWFVWRSQEGPVGHWDADQPSCWVWAHQQKRWTVSR